MKTDKCKVGNGDRVHGEMAATLVSTPGIGRVTRSHTLMPHYNGDNKLGAMWAGGFQLVKQEQKRWEERVDGTAFDTHGHES